MLFALTPSDEGAVEQSEIEGEKRLLKFTVYAILCKIEQSLHRASSVPLPLHKGGDWQKITHINYNLSFINYSAGDKIENQNHNNRA